MAAQDIHVAVIGVGTAGVSAMRWCRARGMPVMGFEREDGCGGIWKWGATHSPTYDSLYTNSSGVMMCLGDYERGLTGKFPHHKETCAYYSEYMDHYKLKSSVRWRTEVERVYRDEGRWAVEYRSVDADPRSPPEMDYFDRIIVATGRLWDPSLPDWVQPLFATKHRLIRPPSKVLANQIEILHSRDYRNPKPFHQKKVVIIGVGNSALDISLELSRDPNVQKPILVSCRRGTVVMPIDDLKGDPIDPVVTSRAFYSMNGRVRNQLMTSNVDAVNKEMRRLGLPPPPNSKNYFATENPVSNLKESRAYIEALKKGLIKFVPSVSGFAEDQSCFQCSDGSRLENVDSAIFCTGYRVGMEFLDPKIRNEVVKHVIQKNGHKIEYADLYKSVLCGPEPTIAFLVLVTSYGNESVVGSMQARWITRFWADEQFAAKNFSFAKFQKDSAQKFQFVVKSCTSNPYFVRTFNLSKL